VEDEGPCQKSRYQDRPDEGQQCRTLECHDRSMNAWPLGTQPMLPPLGSCSQLVDE
jgi:hypothetical protein